ncbi:hypothetical protein [Xenorhabdus ehlersii]|uniref:Uncharacterized protein n=1 Tax=Xenorhabdus ehlersii TaxID=290111 RepID=A0A2D0IKJ9_9GAMM|nr:hypothetical protein [Xenorhabdus ehlersii]PHM22301.1 exported hypothetical protein [Xenorhabdus ehlersii]RKE87873.1 hypothetical protein BDE27_3415 [Xenorhabdus ehlersii]
MKKIKYVIILVIAILVVSGILDIFSQNGLYGFYKRKVAESVISDDVKDPTSVLFKDLYVSKKRFNVVCGKMNAKNGFGAYVGWKAFVTVDKIPIIEDVEYPSWYLNFDKEWYEYCYESDE